MIIVPIVICVVFALIGIFSKEAHKNPVKTPFNKKPLTVMEASNMVTVFATMPTLTHLVKKDRTDCTAGRSRKGSSYKEWLDKQREAAMERATRAAELFAIEVKKAEEVRKEAEAKEAWRLWRENNKMLFQREDS